ncbi:MAG TPA: amidohydrolase, partial [Xanthobacteraceae bacterium]|nr:amidohydrolase [Xanthobacteraceae bacterium]
MTTRTIACAHLIEAPDRPIAANREIRLSDGRVDAVGPIAGTNAEPLFVMPALVNAHDHGRAVRTSSLGSAGKPLETWLQYQALIPSIDPYLVA